MNNNSQPTAEKVDKIKDVLKRAGWRNIKGRFYKGNERIHLMEQKLVLCMKSKYHPGTWVPVGGAYYGAIVVGDNSVVAGATKIEVKK